MTLSLQRCETAKIDGMLLKCGLTVELSCVDVCQDERKWLTAHTDKHKEINPVGKKAVVFHAVASMNGKKASTHSHTGTVVEREYSVLSACELNSQPLPIERH